MKQWTLIAVGGVLLVSVGAFLLLRDGGGQDPEPDSHKTAKTVKRTVMKDKSKAQASRIAAPKTKPATTVGGDGMSLADRKLSEAVQTALDEEDLAGLRKQLAAVRASTNAAVRQAAVDALGWFGTKAMSDIVTFIEDPNEDVRDAARTCWDQAIIEIDEEPIQATIVEETLLGTIRIRRAPADAPDRPQQGPNAKAACAFNPPCQGSPEDRFLRTDAGTLPLFGKGQTATEPTDRQGVQTLQDREKRKRPGQFPFPPGDVHLADGRSRHPTLYHGRHHRTRGRRYARPLHTALAGNASHGDSESHPADPDSDAGSWRNPGDQRKVKENVPTFVAFALP